MTELHTRLKELAERFGVEVRAQPIGGSIEEYLAFNRPDGTVASQFVYGKDDQTGADRYGVYEVIPGVNYRWLYYPTADEALRALKIILEASTQEV